MLEDVYYYHQFLYPLTPRCKKVGGYDPPAPMGAPPLVMDLYVQSVVYYSAYRTIRIEYM